VADVRPYLEGAAVVIVPVRIGGGTRLKILEAMAMGKAVVSTSLGAEGLDALPERDLCLADDAESFAAQIQRLLDEPERARRLGAAARRLVEARYGWAASVARLTVFYDEVLDARGAP
jgi:glycosyltransferase involved in cell wall biosynthesis